MKHHCLRKAFFREKPVNSARIVDISREIKIFREGLGFLAKNRGSSRLKDFFREKIEDFARNGNSSQKCGIFRENVMYSAKQ